MTQGLWLPIRELNVFEAVSGSTAVVDREDDLRITRLESFELKHGLPKILPSDKTWNDLFLKAYRAGLLDSVSVSGDSGAPLLCRKSGGAYEILAVYTGRAIYEDSSIQEIGPAVLEFTLLPTSWLKRFRGP